MTDPTVRQPDLEWLCGMTVRYALGRISYAPGHTVDMVLRYRKYLSQGVRDMIAREVRQHLAEKAAIGGYGPGFDDIRRDWERLADELETGEGR